MPIACLKNITKSNHSRVTKVGFESLTHLQAAIISFFLASHYKSPFAFYPLSLSPYSPSFIFLFLYLTIISTHIGVHAQFCGRSHVHFVSICHKYRTCGLSTMYFAGLNITMNGNKVKTLELNWFYSTSVDKFWLLSSILLCRYTYERFPPRKWFTDTIYIYIQSVSRKRNFIDQNNEKKFIWT